MEYAKEVSRMITVERCFIHGPAPIPQEGRFTTVKRVEEISGFSHSVGTCGLKQGACKLSLNIKEGIIQEALIEVIGCTGMTQSAAMAAEILPGKTLLEALNTDLVCDAINVAMREYFLAMAYGRTRAYDRGRSGGSGGGYAQPGGHLLWHFGQRPQISGADRRLYLQDRSGREGPHHRL